MRLIPGSISDTTYDTNKRQKKSLETSKLILIYEWFHVSLEIGKSVCVLSDVGAGYRTPFLGDWDVS